MATLLNKFFLKLGYVEYNIINSLCNVDNI